ncbi:MAG TPA: bifunctional proline dehydrogenase/L-glutamate gamma-semialdehyde dehydrogenase [Acidimicrobiales bacterium]|nr:bifunctional proline dehydrogenase/L-glutamate gamma-semialdehyde dehydrogenase [Acidimicrobiales bacterium]
MDFETDRSIDMVATASCTRARALIRDAEALRSRHERSVRRRFVRLFRDPHALEVTITLTDEVMRYRSVTSATRLLRRASRRATLVGFGLLNVTGLRLLSLASRALPAPVTALVHSRIRALTGDLILDADPARLGRHIRRRRAGGVGVNVNVLGEAVLGEREAGDRLERVLEMMARDDVNYVSVKLSALVSQIVTVDHAGSLDRVAHQLRTLYQASLRHHTFVNLDMEEYRDLRMTVDAFMSVLGEREFNDLSAGIVLQAYLPDTHDTFAELARWALARRAAGGAAIKVRFVKGANLAMEHAEAQLHGWTPAPYATKAEVDASFARLIDVGLRPELADALRVGVASHNLFHVAWALEVATARAVAEQLDVEMLEGMAPAECQALAQAGQRVLLYAPVTRRDDFAAAVAYLVRRLDENTAPENYLRAAFFIAHDPAVLAEQERRFLDSIAARHELVTASRRHAQPPQWTDDFANTPDADPTDPGVVGELENSLAQVRARAQVVLGDPEGSDGVEAGRDPSAGGEQWYGYHVARREAVDAALERARLAWPAWEARTTDERAQVLTRAAQVMDAARATTIAVMARDTGKTVGEGDPEVSEAVDFVRYYAERARELHGSKAMGVVLVVPPWNFPYSIPAGGVSAALAAGNTVILKPAPEAVGVAWELVNQLWAAGVPRDVVQLVMTRDDDVGRHLVTHDGVDAVILTGSIDTARLFTSWKPSINLLGETSGKNALVITSCADIDLAVKDLVHSAFSNAGQKCSAASLAIVDRATFDNPLFRSQLVDAVTSLRVGPAYDLASMVGPVIGPAQPALERVLDRLDEGESWWVPPRPLDDARLLWSPGVKVGVQPGSWSHLHEWFGPVLAIMVAPDLAHAIAWQNQVAYGLTAGIHSLDELECAQWLDHVAAGNLYVNRAITGAVVRRQPFGGWKRSAVGPTAKAGGANYLACLRDWPLVHDVDAALDEFSLWWDSRGSQAVDESALEVERNIVRYRRPLGKVLVRVDRTFNADAYRYVSAISSLTGVSVEFSAPLEVEGIGAHQVEGVADVVRRASQYVRVRWLSAEPAPQDALLDVGLSTDRRPLAQAGHVEGPRWLLEQSVAVTNHRYGNVHAGPKPACPGLGS